MQDDLDIPEFLKRPPETAEQADARRKRMRNWKPKQSEIKEARVTQNFDREGRPLPRSMDEGSWALLRSMEKEAERKDKAQSAERFRLLKIERDEKRRIKAEAKATKTATVC